MQSKTRLGVFVAALATVLVTAGAARAQGVTDYGAAYGGRAGNFGALMPFFQVGPVPGSTGTQNAIISIVKPNEAETGSEGMHTRIFDINSKEACDLCDTVTPDDVFVEDVLHLINVRCSAATATALADPNNPGGFIGYITFENYTDGSCTAPETDSAFPTERTGDVVPYFYYVSLQQGLATGIDGPVYDEFKTGTNPNFDPYALAGTFGNVLGSDVLYFRYLQALGGNKASARTQIIVWSDTSTRCVVPGGTTPQPDSACLIGAGTQGSFLICDESEHCISQPPPPLNKEVNIFLVDNLIPGTQTDDGGWFRMLSQPNGCEPVAGVQQTDCTNVGGANAADNALQLNVLGYSDNQAFFNTAPVVSERALFPAQRSQNASGD